MNEVIIKLTEEEAYSLLTVLSVYTNYEKMVYLSEWLKQQPTLKELHSKLQKQIDCQKREPVLSDPDFAIPSESGS